MRGLRKYLTPFAPDQSGAVSVLYEFGGIIVICDAGGCTGNICGFDEPRWFERKSALFSAGLRDMDAILGRDRLVAKLADAVTKLDAKFAVIIGTPVPAVIGTDYHALKRMTEKKVDLPILTVDTDGMELYDKGEEKAWQELFRVFAGEKEDVIPGNIGILGMTPQDISDLRAADRIREHFAAEGKTAICYGMGNGLDDVKSVSNVEKHIVVAPAALEAAKYLERTYGTPYEIGYPLVDELVSDLDYSGKKVLIVQQQVMGTAIREEILKQAPDAQVTVASWFMMKPELRQEGDLHLRDEDDYVELVEKGGFLQGLLPGLPGETPAQLLSELLARLTAEDMESLQRYEERLTALEEVLLAQQAEDFDKKIFRIRRELSVLAGYYAQLDDLYAVLADAVPDAEEHVQRLLEHLSGKAQRLLTMTEQEKEYSLQLREMHQTQVDMRQNQIMKILTIVTTVFLPLSLIAGWYGMNFRNMPELTAEHGYLVICIVSAVCVLVELWIFKRKKWF